MATIAKYQVHVTLRHAKTGISWLSAYFIRIIYTMNVEVKLFAILCIHMYIVSMTSSAMALSLEDNNHVESLGV